MTGTLLIFIVDCCCVLAGPNVCECIHVSQHFDVYLYVYIYICMHLPRAREPCHLPCYIAAISVSNRKYFSICIHGDCFVMFDLPHGYLLFGEESLEQATGWKTVSVG